MFPKKYVILTNNIHKKLRRYLNESKASDDKVYIHKFHDLIKKDKTMATYNIASLVKVVNDKIVLPSKDEIIYRIIKQRSMSAYTCIFINKNPRD